MVFKFWPKTFVLGLDFDKDLIKSVEGQAWDMKRGSWFGVFMSLFAAGIILIYSFDLLGQTKLGLLDNFST
jgi:hypothetical protein